MASTKVIKQKLNKLETIMSLVTVEQYLINNGLRHVINMDSVIHVIFSTVQDDDVLLASYAEAMHKSPIYTFSAVENALTKAKQLAPNDSNVEYDLSQLSIIKSLIRSGLSVKYVTATHSHIHLVTVKDITNVINEIIASTHYYFSVHQTKI